MTSSISTVKDVIDSRRTALQAKDIFKKIYVRTYSKTTSKETCNGKTYSGGVLTGFGHIGNIGGASLSGGNW
jgi:hypothetical protein